MLNFWSVDGDDFGILKSNECVCPVGYLWIDRMLKGQFSCSIKSKGVWNEKWNDSLKCPYKT